MTELHMVRCNICNYSEKLNWNGEHYLFPADWVSLVDSDAELKGHLCHKCLKKFKIKLDNK